jgi:hypothetical protein
MKHGNLTAKQIVIACKNVGIDLTCGACATLFYTGAMPQQANHTCSKALDENCMLLLEFLYDRHMGNVIVSARHASKLDLIDDLSACWRMLHAIGLVDDDEVCWGLSENGIVFVVRNL